MARRGVLAAPVVESARRDAEAPADVLYLDPGLMLLDRLDDLFFAISLLRAEISVWLDYLEISSASRTNRGGKVNPKPQNPAVLHRPANAQVQERRRVSADVAWAPWLGTIGRPGSDR